MVGAKYTSSMVQSILVVRRFGGLRFAGGDVGHTGTAALGGRLLASGASVHPSPSSGMHALP